MRQIFQRVCMFAAYGLMVAGALLAVEYTLGLYGIGKVGDYQQGCFFDEYGYACRGFPGASIVAAILNVPLLLFILTPVWVGGWLVALLTTLSLPKIDRVPIQFILILAGATVWLALASIGVWRMLKDAARSMRARIKAALASDA